MSQMDRPCFIVVDREYPGSISTRKLVIETAKLNVLTAYSGEEALKTLKRFPAVSGVVIDATVSDMPCSDLVKALKHVQPKVTIIVIHPPGSAACRGADHYVEFFDPARLLALLEKLQPAETAAIERHEDELSANLNAEADGK